MANTAKRRSFARLVYGLYAWAVLVFVVLPVTAGLLLVPGLGRRRRIAKWGAATVLAMIGSPVTLRGRRDALAGNPVVVANHASYLDGMILTAALPPQYTFLIKREMNAVPIAGFVLRRLGSEFVDREDPAHRHRSGRRLLTAAIDGRAIAVFPEGTFDEHPGLKPFHAGAFRAARRARIPVVPVAIEGSRQKLPSGAWLPAPGPLTVTICEPVPVDRTADVRQLQRLVRSALLEQLGEPDLDPALREAALP